SPLAFGSCCLPPTMWCLLSLVYFCLSRCCRRNETGVPNPGFLVAAFLGYAAYQALVIAPTEQTMGNVQRIFYYHVPSAWTAFLLFSINFIASVTYLIRRNPSADAIALVSAEVGVVFCTVVLVTGPLWARPVWGIWWTWDVRLTSTLV